MTGREELTAALARAEERYHKASDAVAKAQAAAEPFNRAAQRARNAKEDARREVENAAAALRQSLPTFEALEMHPVKELS